MREWLAPFTIRGSFHFPFVCKYNLVRHRFALHHKTDKWLKINSFCFAVPPSSSVKRCLSFHQSTVVECWPMSELNSDSEIMTGSGVLRNNWLIELSQLPFQSMTLVLHIPPKLKTKKSHSQPWQGATVDRPCQSTKQAWRLGKRKELGNTFYEGLVYNALGEHS